MYGRFVMQLLGSVLGRLKTPAILLALPLAAMAGSAASAQEKYPSRMVRIVIPTASGGNVDLLARAIGEKLSERWKQPVIVEAKPGANTLLATLEVTKGKADGYTLLFTISGLVQNLVLQPNPPYRLADLAPVSMVAMFPIALAANASFPPRTIGELVEHAKAKPNTISYGSYGTGSGGHIIGEGLNRAAGIDLQHIAYKGEAASLPDLLTGRIALAYGSTGFYGRQLSTNSIRLLAVAAPKRLKSFPDVPTFAEAGFAGINLAGWGGMFLSAGTPAEIVKEVGQQVRQIVALPEIQSKIYDMGFEPVGNSEADFAQALNAELEKWRAIVKDSNIKLE
jgi:tripartite-type tricarboxylate transporter receptor subunit TctC